MRVSALFVWCIAALISLPNAVLAQNDGEATRNAIFNGNFLEGRAGWSIGGPEDLEVKTFRTMIADKADAELSLRHDGLEETMTLFSQYPIRVEPGRDYRLTLTAAGEATIAFGVYEYNERGKNTVFPISEPIVLTEEPQAYEFTYTASEQASTIRPRIRIIGQTPPQNEPGPEQEPPEDGGAFHVRLLDFALMLPEESFASSVEWPEWAVSGELHDYQGLTEEQIQQIRQATAVDRILPPYEPVRTIGNGVYSLTMSQFDFGGSVFPEQITILDEPILSRPIDFKLQTADGRSITRSDGETSYEATDQRAVAHQTARGDGWTLEMTGTLEYDALLIVDMQLQADDDVRLTSGSVSIPLTEQAARYIRYHKDFGHKRPVFGEGPIPSPGEAVEVLHTFGRAAIKNDWSPVAPAPERGVLWEWDRGAPWYFWLGDERKGIGWIVESEQGWSVAEGDVTLALERTSEGLDARVSFITEPVTVRDSWHIRLILQAMPPKPVRPDWFKLRFSRFWNWAPGDEKMIERIEQARAEEPASVQESPPPHVLYAHAGDGEGEMRPPWESLQHPRPKDIGILNWKVWSVGCGSPQVAKPEMMRRYLEAGEYVGHMALPYLAPTHLSVNDLNGCYYAARNDEWSKLPPVGETSLYVKVCPNSFASEYQAFEIGRLIDEYGIEGVYFDNTHPSECSNLDHGCGYVDPDGVTRPTTPVLAMRRLFMMVREQFVKRGKTPFIFKHAGKFPAEISFVDANLDGEGVYGYDHTQMFTTGEFRASWIGPNQYGLVQVYLPQFAVGVDTELSGGEQVRIGTPRLLALTLIHGTPIYCGNANAVLVSKAWSVLDELRGPTVDFIPYWEWPWNAKINPRGLYATLYRQSDNAVLVVSNLSETQTGMAIPRSELDRLVPGFETAEDHMHRWRVVLDDESLRISVPEKSFRMISLR